MPRAGSLKRHSQRMAASSVIHTVPRPGPAGLDTATSACTSHAVSSRLTWPRPACNPRSRRATPTALLRDRPLASSRYQGSASASEMDERIEDFGRDTVVGDLHDLPTGPG